MSLRRGEGATPSSFSAAHPASKLDSVKFEGRETVGTRNITLGLVMVGAIATGGTMTASPAWATSPGASETSSGGCRLTANEPSSNGSRVRGEGARSNCSNTVTYFWVRVYKVVPFWPDSEKAVKGQTYVQNGKLVATGACDGRGEHYTHVSTASGASGGSVESGRIVLC